LGPKGNGAVGHPRIEMEGKELHKKKRGKRLLNVLLNEQNQTMTKKYDS